MVAVYENSHAYFEVENRVVQVRLKPKVVLDLATAVAISSDRMRLQHYRPYALVFDITNILHTDQSGRDFMALNGFLFTTQVCVVAGTPKSAIIARFLSHTALFQSRFTLFKDQKSALSFLMTTS